jgi:hypothetical protein
MIPIDFQMGLSSGVKILLVVTFLVKKDINLYKIRFSSEPNV